MLRDKPEDAEVLAYGEALVAALNKSHAFGQPIRALSDKKPDPLGREALGLGAQGRADHRRARPRDAAGGPGHLHAPRRPARRRPGEEPGRCRWRSSSPARRPCCIRSRTALYQEAKARLDGNIVDGVADFAALAEHFGPAASDDEAGSRVQGLGRVAWCKPTGEALDQVDKRLKALKLTIRNAPMRAARGRAGPCIFTGAAGGGNHPDRPRLLIARP